jgi:hypothetical protein
VFQTTGVGPTGAGTWENLAKAELNYSCGRDQASTNIWLNREDGLSLNLTPWVVPFDCWLVAISMRNRKGQVETWTAEVYTNAGISSGTPNIGNALATQAITAGEKNYGVLATPVSLTAGDDLAVFMRGQGVQRPGVELFLMRRP